jgi:hypothetical protein
MVYGPVLPPGSFPPINHRQAIANFGGLRARHDWKGAWNGPVKKRGGAFKERLARATQF